MEKILLSNFDDRINKNLDSESNEGDLTILLKDIKTMKLLRANKFTASGLFMIDYRIDE